MEAVNIQFAPETGTEEEWNEAYARLADYFRSYQLHNRIRRTQLILETLRRAAVAHQKDPSRTPTTHSIEQARLMMREWLAAIYESPFVGADHSTPVLTRWLCLAAAHSRR